ncbi:TPA: hypothetical protein ACH3X1_002486 [Trebouxia sp. C0004]
MAAITVEREGTGGIITFDTVAEVGSAAEFISYIEKVWGEGVLLKPSSTSAFTARTPEPFPHGIYTFLPKSAMGPGGLDYETLHRRLSLLRSYVDLKVLNQMIRFFAPQIPLADQQLLSQLYDTAKASPLTSTRASLRVDEGLVFNGEFAGGTPGMKRCGRSSSMYLVCRWPCCVPDPNAPQLSMTFVLAYLCL